MYLFFLTLLSIFSGGSGNDLLDYVPTDAYWNAKHVVVSVESMASQSKLPTDKDIAGWIADLDAADPQTRDAAYRELLHSGPAILPKLEKITDGPAAEPAQRARVLIAQINAAPKRDAVRRLMAIRTLGELKKQEGLPVLRPFLNSKEMFVADYARIATAQIEGKPTERTRAVDTDKDAWLLPAECRAVAHVELHGGRPIDYAAAFKQFPLPVGEDNQVAIDFIANQALTIAETIGNVRLDALTIGVSGDVSDKSGCAVVIAAGQYDAPALNQFARKLKIVFKTVDGHDVFQPDADKSAFLPSNDRLVLVAKPTEQDAPLAEMISAMKSGAGKLKTTPEMANLLAKVDVKQPVWAVMKVTDAYRKAPQLEAFDEVALVGRREGPGIHLTVHGTGPDPAKVKAAADLAAAAITQAAKDIRKMASTSPALGNIADLFDQMKVAASGNGASITVDVPELPIASRPGQSVKSAPKE
ncbi:MAG: hypothetical protein JWN51_3597 [Phycisphaerales bacterium]|nr:hypothetical protein [Phycisphaerales bacterium]